jgi:hypothetical protein
MIRETTFFPVNGKEHSFNIFKLPDLAVCSIVTTTCQERQRQREREKEREKERQRQRGRQRDRDRERETERERERKRDRERERERQRERERDRDRERQRERERRRMREAKDQEYGLLTRFPEETRSMAPPIPFTILPGMIQFARSPN